MLSAMEQAYIEVAIESGDGQLDYVAEAMPNVGNRMMAAVAGAYARYVKANAFRGQIFKKTTGRLYRSTGKFRIQKGVWAVRPGIGVRGSLNFMNKFERGAKPFMEPTFERFKSEGHPQKMMRWVYEKVIEDSKK